MLKVFISYSHVDEQLRNELDKHLSVLKHEGRIETWHDRRMLGGNEVDPTIQAELEAANIVLLLVSSDFLASYYCYEREMKRALERHAAGDAIVVPIILRDCDWTHSPLGKLLALPTDGKPVKSWTTIDEPFMVIAKELRRIVDKASTKSFLKSGGTKGASQADKNLFDRIVAAATQPPDSQKMARSANLRIRQKFTDHQRDEFLREAFRFIGSFIEGSLRELKLRNPDVEYSFTQISAVALTAVIYREGRTVSRCGISLSSRFGSHGEILYSNSGTIEGSYNEALSVGEDDQMLFLKASMFGFGRDERKLTHEGAAELFWETLIGPLQR